MSNRMKKITQKQLTKKLDKFQKTINKLDYVRSAIEIDMKKISTKSKEYKSMLQRANNLMIAIVKTTIKQQSLLLSCLVSVKKGNA